MLIFLKLSCLNSFHSVCIINPYIINNNKRGNKINELLDKYSKINNCDVLLRKSGTENLLRLMVQAESKSLVDKIVKEFLVEIKKLDEN